MLNRRFKKLSSNRGFTLVEMLIVAPIVVLVIGVFISALVGMTGDVLVVRGSNALSYNIQDALNRIDLDVKTSGGYLAKNDVVLSSPQGLKDDATNFYNVQKVPNADATNGTMLIIKAFATTKNPIDPTKSYVYQSNQPKPCNDQLVSQNSIVTFDIVYFVKSNTLWRRVLASSNYNSAGCSLPWQQPTCTPGYGAAFCKANDIKLVDGITSLGINYYTSSDTANPIADATDPNVADSDRQTAIGTARTVGITINATKKLAGRDISKSSTIRTNAVGKGARASCLEILNAGESTGDGVYLIYPAGTSGFQSYCDMQNGGWTRLNNNIATSTTPFNNSDILITNNIPGGCGTPGCPFTINNISLQHSNVKVLLTRTTSIVQCSSLVGVGSSTTYWNGSSWVSNTMCTWSDGIFANATSTNMTGLKMLWKLEGPKAANGEIKFNSQCSDGTDSGQIQITTWVK